MGEEHRNMEKNHRVKMIRKFWGLRPWKRHSTILMVVGILYTFIGFQYTIAEPSRAREAALVVALQIAPIQVWGGIFMLAGILTSISSRWPPFAEKWGYMLLTGLSAAWGSTYLIGLLFFNSPPLVISQSILWGILAFMWWAISGLLNPDSTGVTKNGSD